MQKGTFLNDITVIIQTGSEFDKKIIKLAQVQ